jgi:hypothetical protein
MRTGSPHILSINYIFDMARIWYRPAGQTAYLAVVFAEVVPRVRIGGIPVPVPSINSYARSAFDSHTWRMSVIASMR